MPVELQAELSPRTLRHFRFIVEALLMISLLAGLWLVLQGSESLYMLVHSGLRSSTAFRLYLLVAVGFVFLLIVYYGTSFEVTPLQLISRPIGKFARIRELTPPNRPPISVAVPPSTRDEISSEDEYIESEDLGTELIDDIAEDTTGTADTVERVLRRSSHSASHLARKMERRINTHLILGVLIGLVGLAVWYYSFFITPGSPNKSVGGTSSISSATDGAGKSESTSAAPTRTGSAVIIAWDLIPRITILLFIELLAGFFLRQYRIGVEDFKYFLELQRRAEASRVAYAIFDQLGDTESKRKFATTLLEARSDFRLQKDETTTLLETMKSEENTTLKLISVLGDHLESVTKLLRKDKEK